MSTKISITGSSEPAGTAVARVKQPLGPQPDTSDQSPRRRYIALIILVAVVVIGSYSFYKIRSNRTRNTRATERVATARKQDFVRSVRFHGTVEAIEYYSVAAPRLAGERGGGTGGLVITKLVPTGSNVKKGDLLVEFDRQQQQQAALDREADYRDLLEQIAKRRAEQTAALAADRTELTRAENNVQRAKLELRKNEVVSQIDAEKNQQSLEEATAALNQLRETFNLKRKAAAAELRILEIQRDRAQNAMVYARSNSEKMALRSPIDGVVVLNSIWRSGSMGEVQEGDEIRSGTPFMQVVNPVAMQVRARANQADIREIEDGQPVKVSLDAYPELSFDGKVERIEAVGQTSQMSARVRTFSILIGINGSHPKLLPGLSAAVDVDLQRSDPSITVPRDAIVKENNQYFVYAKSGNGSSKQQVKVGAMNDVDAVIESGLKEGAVVLRNPAGANQ